ncbi:MAG: murein transglycosylase A [Pontixanthobacter sp.]
MADGHTRLYRLLIPVLAAVALPACAGTIPPARTIPQAVPPVTTEPPAPSPIVFTPDNAALAPIGIAEFPPGLGTTPSRAQQALQSFVASCRVATRRSDRSGLTTPEQWVPVCERAAAYRGDAQAFFVGNFTPIRIGPGEAFATGYFEPEIRGCRTPRPSCDTPVYGLPDDLVRQWPADMAQSERTGRAPLGRVDENGVFVPYYTRAQIEDGAMAMRNTPIAYAADPVEFFFLQIQGSGRLMLDDGTIMRIGYAGQNGYGYTGIGGVMRERGLLGDGPGQYAGSMQGIMAYIRENPVEGRALMRLNESWVFFRVLEGEGPIGSIGVPVRGNVSVAVDPRFVPYGAPVLLDLDRNEADGIWIAQDTGGAIKGMNRFDTFWGAGEDARRIAGGMSGRGSALILLPNEAAAQYRPR